MGCPSAFTVCKNCLSAQFLRTTAMSAVVLIPQFCFSVISSVLLQTLICYQFLIPVQSLDLVLLPLAPAYAEGDTSCANMPELFFLCTPALKVWLSPATSGKKDPQLFLQCCASSYYCFAQCKWLGRCESGRLSADVLGIIGTWNLSCVYVNGGNCSMVLKDRVVFSEQKIAETVNPTE